MTTKEQQLAMAREVEAAGAFLVSRGFKDLSSFSALQVVDLLCEYRALQPKWDAETFAGPAVALDCGCVARVRDVVDGNKTGKKRTVVEAFLRGLPCAHAVLPHPPLNLRVAVIAKNCECEYRGTFTTDVEDAT